jgi:HEAT repeat protein
MINQLSTSIARIFTEGRSGFSVVGAGFLVSEKHLLTCAHVVAEALQIPRETLEMPSDEILLDFPLIAPGKTLTGRVVRWLPIQTNMPFSLNEGEDIAVLELKVRPDDVHPMRLVTADEWWGHDFEAYGFPEWQDTGVWASGKLRRKQGTGWIQIEDDKQTGYRVQLGFSGGAVWDKQLEGVVGMVVAEESASDVRAAFVIPVDVLIKAWPELTQYVSDEFTSIADELKTYLQKLHKDLSVLPIYLHDLHGFDFDGIRQRVRISQKRLTYRVKEKEGVPRAARQVKNTGKETEEEEASQKHLEEFYLRRGADMYEQLEETEAIVVDWDSLRGVLKRAVILGDPGFGKSWLLQHEGRQVIREQLDKLQKSKHIQDEVILPIHLRLATLAKKFAEDSTDLREAIVNVLQLEYDLSKRFVTWVKQRIVSSQCLLLLDALDEVAEERIPELLAALKRLAEQTQCRMLLTSRIAGYTGVPFTLQDEKQEREVELVGFNKEQVTGFVESWFAKHREQGQQLLEILFREPTLRTLSRIPLLLSFICITSYGNESTPTTRAKLYENTLRRLLRGQWRSIELQERDEGRLESKLALLERIAWHFAVLNGRWCDLLPADELNRVIQQAPEEEHLRRAAWDNRSLLHELSERDGVLVKAGEPHLGTDKISYLFLHRTFHEYLVAEYLSKLKTDEWLEQIKLHLWFDPDWEMVIILLGEFPETLSSLLQVLLQEPNDAFHTMLLLAGRCLAEGRKTEATQETEERIIQNLLRLLHSASKLDRDKAVRVLGQIGKPAVEGLLAMLQEAKHEMPYVREAAAEALIRMNEPQVVEALLTILRNKDRKHQATPPQTAQTIRSDKDRMYQILRAEMIKVIGQRPSIGKAVQALLQDQDKRPKAVFPFASQKVLQEKDRERQEIRAAIARALGQSNNAQVAQDLLEVMRDPDEWDYSARLVRQSVVQALGQIGGPLVVKELLEVFRSNQTRDDDFFLLQDTTSPSNASFRIHEAIMEEKRNRTKSLEWLIEPVGWDVIMTFHGFLPLIQKPLDIEHYSNIIIHTQMLRQIAEALSRCGKFAVEGLLTLLQYTHNEDLYLEHLRGEMCKVVQALGQIYGPQVVKNLGIALPNKNEPQNNPYLWRVIARVLGQIDEQALLDNSEVGHTSQPVHLALEQLFEQLLKAHQYRDRDHAVHQLATRALEQIGDQRAVEALLLVLQDKEDTGQNYWGMCWTAIRALGQIGDQRAVEALLRILHDRNELALHEAAIEALGQIGTPSAVDHLLEVLCDKDYSEERRFYVRAQAVEALGQIGDQRATDALLAELSDKDWYIRRTAAMSLGHIGTQQTARRLLEAVQEIRSNWRIFDSARHVLRHIGNFSAMKEAFLEELRKWMDMSQMEKIVVVAIGQSGSPQIEGSRSLEKDLLAIQRDKDEDWFMREAATKALGWFGSPQAIRGLLAVLRDRELTESALAALEILVQNCEPESCCKCILHVWSHKALDDDILVRLYELLNRLAPRLRITTGDAWPAWCTYLIQPTNRILQIGLKGKSTLTESEFL